MLSSNDHILGIITRPFETALFFPPPLSILMCSCAPQGAQHLQGGNHTAFCGAELKGFTLHHFKPHFQPPHCCLCAAGESSSSLKVPYFFIAVALSNPEYSHLIFFVFPWTEMERKKNVFWCNWHLIPLSKGKRKGYCFLDMVTVEIKDKNPCSGTMKGDSTHVLPYSKAKSQVFF